ncbi:hypothetical protein EOS_20030 [Caballeronia mineralivorans PML1(12)]|uniref:Transposase n=1 Tax=Caballeronia mineralivorans PML1(12) TaxID=908627 RepID=A0A0J1CVV3_9BURK|nr:hypothetical protein EOS_20030 [Caballeronia mineralivorans PML1(12)]
MRKMLRKAVPVGLTKVLKRRHYPLDVILRWVRWYVAYSLSLRNLEEMNFRCASNILSGIETMHMIRKGQMKTEHGTHQSAAEQFYSLII